jgi:L-aspartate oxidase
MAESRSAPIRADIAVVGAGAAGIYAALAAAREGARVVLVSRSPLALSAC